MTGCYKVEATCPDCGNTREIVWQSTKPQKRRCGSCARKKANSIVERSCAACGTTIRIYRSAVARGQGKYCSKQCAGRSRKGLRSPRWEGHTKKRAAWDARLRRECEICGDVDRVRNHHIIYAQHVRKRDGDEWDPRNAISLCMSCHSRHHSGTSFRILVCDLPQDFWAFGNELLGDALWDYLARHYDDGNSKLEDLLVNH